MSFRPALKFSTMYSMIASLVNAIFIGYRFYDAAQAQDINSVLNQTLSNLLPGAENAAVVLDPRSPKLRQ